MNVVSGVSVVTGVAAPPVQPVQTQPTPVIEAAGAVAPAPAAAVQQVAQATGGAAAAPRRVASEPHSPERLKDARIAWTEGKPQKAPGVWPMFPILDHPAPDEQPARAHWTQAARGRAPEAIGVNGGLIEAVRVVRGGSPDFASAPLGLA